MALTELEAAYYAGFKRWAHFLIARKRGLFPEPVRNLPGVGPLWTRQQIDRWLGVVVTQPAAETDPWEEELLRRVRGAAQRGRPQS